MTESDYTVINNHSYSVTARAVLEFGFRVMGSVSFTSWEEVDTGRGGLHN